MSMSRRISVLAIFLLRLSAAPNDESRLLTRDELTVLMLNTPAVLALECRRGCPQVDIVSEGTYLMSIQLRNACPSNGSGLIDNYTVDLRTGEIWTGVDERKFIESERLRLVRRVLFRLRSPQSHKER